MHTKKNLCDSNTAPNEDADLYARQIFDLGEGGSSSRKWCDTVGSPTHNDILKSNKIDAFFLTHLNITSFQHQSWS